MFWGLIMEPNKRYSQTVENSFHVSMASLDLSSADDGVVQVMLCYGDKNYLLCSLKKGSTWQVPLDLSFQEGTKIAFTCNGHGHVHLTGYLIMDDMDMDDLEENEQDDEEEEVPMLVEKNSKRKAIESPKNRKESKRPKQETAESSDDDDDDDELDGMDEDETDDSEDEDDVEEGEDSDDEDEEDEEEENEEQMQVQKKPTKPQQQDKKGKQAKEQQQQQLQKKKHDKQKLVNGKETKEQQSKQQKKNKGDQSTAQQNNQTEPKKRIVEGGVQIEELKIGNGIPAKPGKFVSVYYVGRLKNGKKFDATAQGDGFKFRLGKGEVIRGWDVGIAGMKIGGKRRITIPPNMGYGVKGSPPTIPANSTLIFDVELRNVH